MRLYGVASNVMAGPAVSTSFPLGRYMEDNDYLGDLDVFLNRVRWREPHRPLFLFGHSMGGAIVTLYTIEESREAPPLAGLLLSGAALEADVSGVAPWRKRA